MQKFILLCSCVFVSMLAETTAMAQLTVWSNVWGAGWENYSYNSTLNFQNTSPLTNSSEYSIAVTITAEYGGFVPYIPPTSDAAYGSVSFWINGGPAGGQHLQMYGNLGTGPSTQASRVALSPKANTWTHYTISLASLDVSNQATFSGFAIQDSAGTAEPVFYLDNILLTSSTLLTANAGTGQTNCTGGSTTIGGNPTAIGGGGGYTYSWSPATGLNSATVANPTASPTATTTYTVTVTDAAESTALSTVTVTVSPDEAGTASAGTNQTIAAGNNTAGLGGSVGGGATGGIWTTSGSGTFVPGATTLNAIYDPSANDIAAGTVTLTLTTTGPVSPCAAATAQVVVIIQGTTVIYSNALVNGWVDASYETTLNYANTSPVNSGSEDSISATITSSYGGFGVYHAPMSDSARASVSFWLNGGATGGQNLQMYGTEGGYPEGFCTLTAPLANSWQQYFVPLSALGVEDATNFTGFVIQDSAGTGEPTFYVDDIELTSATAPPLTTLTVNAGQPIRMADPRLFGLNTAIWDGNLDTPDTIMLLTNMGVNALRYPGGSDSDNYHWVSNGLAGGGYASPSASLASFIQVITNIGGETMITMNYGTGTSNEAAAWVAYVNASTTNTTSLGVDEYGINWQTAGYWASLRAAAPLKSDDGKNFLRISHTAPLGFEYWEIGNEVYGASWETDNNVVAHDPYTYAMRSAGYIGLIKAVDPTVKIGVVVETGEDSYINNYDHYVLNPVTERSHYGWTPVLLATLSSLGVTPDFAIFHNYPQNPGSESDAGLLASSTGSGGWADDAANLRMMLTDYMGSAGANTELVCTENNSVSSGPGKQSVSLVNGLYKLDSQAQLMQTEFNGLFWWDLRNGQSSDYNDSATLYGWREYGDYGIANSDSDLGETDLYPTYYVSELMKNFVQESDTVITAASTYPLLSIYAVQRQDGRVTALVINKDPVNTLAGEVQVSGFTPASGGVVYSYGMPQDSAVENDTGSPNVAQTAISVSGTNISYAFAPYSATVISLSPSPAKLQAVTQSAGQLVFQLQGQSGVPYVIETSTNMITWTQVSANTPLSNMLNITNSVTPTQPEQFWRVVWKP